MDAEGSESADTEDGTVTPDYPRRGRPRRADDPLALSDVNAMAKRNKSFYRQLRDLDTGEATPEIGFVNDLFFVMDPKLHVGPSNRDGTFEKRVRLHFIEYLELKLPSARGNASSSSPSATEQQTTNDETNLGENHSNTEEKKEIKGENVKKTKEETMESEQMDSRVDEETASTSASVATPPALSTSEQESNANQAQTSGNASTGASGNGISSPNSSSGSHNLWLCWGTLLDTSKTPIFRQSSQFYRIPGNQSSVLRSHSRAPHAWDVADVASASYLRNLATQIASALNEHWDGANITSARALVDTLKLVLPTSTPLDEKGDFLPPSAENLFKELLENFLNRTPVPSPNAMEVTPEEELEPHAVAQSIWRTCGLKIPLSSDVANRPVSPSSHSSWTDEPVSLDGNTDLQQRLCAAVGIAEPLADAQYRLLRLFLAPEGKFTFADLELALRRFGGRKSLIKKMLDVLSTGAFNGALNSAATRTLLQDQPDGTYLIRFSQQYPENFVLCSRVQNSINQINKICNQQSAGLEIEIDGRLCQVTQWASILKSCPAMTTPIVSPQNAAHYKDHGIPIVELLADRRFQIPAETFASLPARARQGPPHASDTESTDSSADDEPTTTSPHLDFGSSNHSAGAGGSSSSMMDSSSNKSSSNHSNSHSASFAADKMAARAAAAASLSCSGNANLAAAVASAAAAAAAANKDLTHEDSVKLAKHELEAKLSSERSADILSYLSQLRSKFKIDEAVFHEWCLVISSAKGKEITPQLHSLLLAFREEPELWIGFANQVIPSRNPATV